MVSSVRVERGAVRLGQEAQHSLRQLGILTAREVEVLRMMAHGRSNTEVATGVFVVGPSDGEQLLDEPRGPRPRRPQDPMQRVDEVLDVDHAALQQIVAPLSAGEQCRRLIDLDIGR